MSISLNKENESVILSLARSGRVPHTVIIEGDSKDERDSAALLLAAGAVCIGGSDKPCLDCKPCRKILDGSHPDVIVPMPSKTSKTGIISIKDLREKYLSLAGIKPNEADLKIYIFYDADKLLREDSQNTLLKIIEEPPQQLLFIFTVTNAEALLPTVRSRAHMIKLRRAQAPDEAALKSAEAIADGMLSLYEYDLLSALSQLGDKKAASDALCALIEELRAALLYQSGITTDDPTAKKLSKKLDRARLMELMTLTRETIDLLKTNVNQQLLLTRLCTRYRRITWQK